MKDSINQKHLHNLGKLIKELREMCGLSQTRLAKLAGLSRSVISDIEQEKRFPNALTLLKLCSVFEISLTELCSAAFNDWQVGASNNERYVLHKAMHSSMNKKVTDVALSKFRKK